MKLSAHLLALVLAGTAVGCGGEVESPEPGEQTPPAKTPTGPSAPGVPAVQGSTPNATNPNSTPAAAEDAGASEETGHPPDDNCPACGMG